MQIKIHETKQGYECHYCPNCWSEVVVAPVNDGFEVTYHGFDPTIERSGHREPGTRLEMKLTGVDEPKAKQEAREALKRNVAGLFTGGVEFY